LCEEYSGKQAQNRLRIKNKTYKNTVKMKS